MQAFKKPPKGSKSQVFSGRKRRGKSFLRYVRFKPVVIRFFFFLFSMALLELVVLLLATSVCLSASVGPLEIHQRNIKIKRLSSRPSAKKCLMTCLEGKPQQICFDEGIHDARPAPVLPDYVCKSIGCLTKIEPCRTKATTFPFECMMESVTRGNKLMMTTSCQSATFVFVEWSHACSVHNEAAHPLLAMDKR